MDTFPGCICYSRMELNVAREEFKLEDSAYEDATGDEIYGYEDNLHSSPKASSCGKNSGHREFIPVKEFKRKHLPDELSKDSKCFNYIRAMADTVVRIEAFSVSTDRPQHFPHFNRRGRSQPRVGSGWIKSVFLCGQPGECAGGVVDDIQRCLMNHRLDELKNIQGQANASGLLNCPSEHFKNGRPQIADYVEHCINLWATENLRGSPNDEPECVKDVSTTLAHDIEQLVTWEDQHKDLNTLWGNSCITLNDYRKRKGLGVIEFCRAMFEGLGESRASKLMQEYWQKYAPFMDKPCPCHHCSQSEDPKKRWWMAQVATAAHVIYDNQEVKGAEVMLFYDDTDSPQFTVPGLPVLDVDPASCLDFPVREIDDCFTFLCIIHDDDDAGNRLKSQLQKIEEVQPRSVNASPTVVISHPHGSTKHISVGRNSKPFRRFKRSYDTATCPGSSGGLVLEFSEVPIERPHSRRLKDGFSLSGSQYLYGKVAYLDGM